MRSKTSVQNLKAISKCMFKILTALCFFVAFMGVGGWLLLENKEALRAVLSEDTILAIRKVLKILFRTASVYQSLELIFTVLFSTLAVVSFFTCIFSVSVHIIIFSANHIAKRRAAEDQHTFEYNKTVFNNNEGLFLLFGRIRV